MLLKRIQKTYAASLTRDRLEGEDVIARQVPPKFWIGAREQVLRDLSDATAYILDADAAGYADGFREDLLREAGAGGNARAVARLMSEVALPHDLTWIEFDQGRLIADRIKRHRGAGPRISPEDFGAHGFLIDGRDSSTVAVTLFRSGGRTGRVIDPLISLHFARGDDGRADMSTCRWAPQPYMHALIRARLHDERWPDRRIEQEFAHATYEIALPYLVFSMIASRDAGVVFERQCGMTRQMPVHFGPSEALKIEPSARTHIVVRIGALGRRHLSERAARQAHACVEGSGHAASIGRWLATYERHYKDGRIGLVRERRSGADHVPAAARDPVTPERE